MITDLEGVFSFVENVDTVLAEHFIPDLCFFRVRCAHSKRGYC